MKKIDLEKHLKRLGWWLVRHGGNHDIWTNGEINTQIPRHANVNETLAKSILRKAEKKPSQGE